MSGLFLKFRNVIAAVRHIMAAMLMYTAVLSIVFISVMTLDTITKKAASMSSNLTGFIGSFFKISPVYF